MVKMERKASISRRRVRLETDEHLIEITELKNGYAVAIYEVRTVAYPFESIEEALSKAIDFISDC
ncbi:MAG: hypothetical protein DRO11_10250 [Methanobacteriota archaeon]|nr:MAG: hypothetical protein DRO11_10250 [Euryarchaeota archaeon]